jgi:hypothetical protein
MLKFILFQFCHILGSSSSLSLLGAIATLLVFFWSSTLSHAQPILYRCFKLVTGIPKAVYASVNYHCCSLKVVRYDKV